jgi:carboxyl-terminal processing protease
MTSMLTTLLLLLLAQQPATGEPLDQLLDQASEAGSAAVLTLADASELLDTDDWQDQAVELLADSKGNQALLLGRLLAQVGDDRAAAALIAMLDANRDQAMAALATLSLGTFDLNDEVQQGLIAWLTEFEPDHDAKLYCEACLTLYQVGDGARRRAALRYLARTRESLEDETRNEGALAMGRTHAILDSDTIDLLEQMANGISPHAALAIALLDKQEQRDRFRSKLEAIDKLYAEQAAERDADSLSADNVGMLDRILSMSQRDHMEGEKYTRTELLGAAADGMLKMLDPYSTYFTGDEFEDFWFDLNPEYGGIGAYVNTINGVFTIVRPIYSGPAFEAGLMSEDKILSVDGWNTMDQPNDDVIKRLKGPPGTKVALEVFRDGWPEPRKIEMERRKIELPVLQQEMLPGNVLYLELVSFTLDCGPLVAQAIRGAQMGGELNGVVLDLRNNPGGSLTQAVRVCDVFLPEGKLVVTTRARVGEVERLKTRSPALVDESIPLTILVNEYSASASEIVSGALSIHGRATTVGERTFGKGSVQVMRPLPGLGDEPYVDENRNRRKDEWEEYTDANGNGKYDFGPKVKLTVAYYFLPDGTSIHSQRDHKGRMTQKGGVEPDLPVDFWRYEPIVLRELDRLLSDKKFQTFAKSIVDAEPELAVDLAEYDAREASRYPGWDEFYASLETFLDEDVARQWVRRRLRVMVSDQRGKVFPGGGFRGDFEEDPQLGMAIRTLLKAQGHDAMDVPEYAAAFQTDSEPESEDEESRG